MSPKKRPFSSAHGSARTQESAVAEGEPSTSVQAIDSDSSQRVHVPTSTYTADIQDSDPAKKRKQAKSIVRPVIEATKSKLYTLNPFAIGVKYLRPQRKGTTAENSASKASTSASSQS